MPDNGSAQSMYMYRIGFKSLKGYLAARTSGEGFSATQQELAAVSNCSSHA